MADKTGARRHNSKVVPVRHANRFIILALVAGGLASGCATVGPNYKPSTAPVAPNWLEFEDPRLADSSPIVPLWWKQAFRDPVLDRLVDEALAGSLTLRSAALRVLQAHQQLLIVKGQRLPQEQYLAVSGSGTDSGASGSPAANFGASFTLSWEIDVFGRLRRQAESASASYDAALSSYDGVTIALIGDVAQTYLLIRTTEQRLSVARQNLNYQAESVRISQAKLEAGEVSSLDVEQGRTLLYNTRASIALLDQSLKQLKVSLAVLLGQPPQDMTERLGTPKPIPVVSPLLAVGMPQDLIRRRPDIRVAERRAAAQCAQIGVAVSDLYPRFGLTGSIGPVMSTAADQHFSDLFSLTSIAWNVAGLVKWNVFNWGRIKNNVRLQDATFQQLIEDYRQVVLQAQAEVELSLIAYFQSHLQLEALQQAADAAQRAANVSIEQYQDGAVDFNTVVSNLRTLVAQQDQLASIQGAVAANLVGVYLSLGGGWEIRQGANPGDVVPEKTKEELKARGKYWGDPKKDQ